MENKVSKQPSEDKSYIPLKMAEFLSKPVTVIDGNGTHYSFRKYLWLGNWGFTDESGTNIIVPAKPGYKQVGIFISSQVLVAGCPSTGWDVFSFEGKEIDSYPPMFIDELQELINK